jgi:hypothetical protein
MLKDHPRGGRPMSAGRSFDSARVFGPRISVEAHVHSDGGAGRRVPANRFCPAHHDRYQRVRRRPVRVCRHAARIIGALTPQWRSDGCFPDLSGLGTTLGGKPIAHTISGVGRCCIEQQYRSDDQGLEEGLDHGEVKVYRSGASPQQYPNVGPQSGGETGITGCRMLGEERVQFGVRFHPPSLCR